MIDEKKLIEELEKWMNDTAYLKEKYSGETQFKDGTGENIMYAHAEIAHDVLSEVIDKINEQPKVDCAECEAVMNLKAALYDEKKKTEWIPCSEQMPPEPNTNNTLDKNPVYLVSVNGEDYPYRALWNGRNFMNGFLILEAVAWMPLPESCKPRKE